MPTPTGDSSVIGTGSAPYTVADDEKMIFLQLNLFIVSKRLKVPVRLF